VSLGAAALVSPLGLGRHNLVLDVAALTALLPLVLLLALPRGRLPRAVGALLVAGYAAAAAWLFLAG
jgi:Ca2+/Na+ antiporter